MSWLLLLEGRMLRTRTLRHLIHILRWQMEKAERALLRATAPPAEGADAIGGETLLTEPTGAAKESYAAGA